MKSTKKIFVVAIAALMLFAFTACNNTMPSAFKSVEYVEVQQIESFLKGEAVKESGFQVVINYTEGEPTVLKGSKGTIKFVGKDGTSAGTALATVADGLKFYDKKDVEVPAVPAEIAYEDVTSVTIEGVTEYTVETSATAPWKLSSFDYSDKALKDVTVTLTGGDVSRTYTIQDKLNDKIDFVLSLWKDGEILEENDTVAAGNVYTVTFDKYRYTSTPNAPWEADFTNGDKNPGLETSVTVKVVDKAAPATIDSFKIYYTVKNGTDVIANKVSTLPDLYTGDTVEISVYEVMTDNTESTTPTDEAITVINQTVPYTGIAFKNGVATVSVDTTTAEKTKTAEGSVQIKVGDKYLTASYSVPTGANYIDRVTVAQAETVTSVYAGQTIGVSGENSVITTKVDYEDTANAPATSSGVVSVLRDTVVPELAVGSEFTTVCTTTYPGRAGEQETVYTLLSFSVVAKS